MWIRSQPLFTARRPNVSPPGYQSPALGDSVPVPGSQDTQRVTPQPGVTISSLSRTPRLFTSVTSQTRARREVNNEPQVSQEPTPTTHNHHSEHLQPPSPSLIFNTRTRCHVTDSDVATTQPLHFVKPEPPNDVFHLGLTRCEEYEMRDDRQHASAALCPCPPSFTFV
jgi:hypothetical protein